MDNKDFVSNFLRSNAVVRKAFGNLDKASLQTFQDIVEWKIDPKKKEGRKVIRNLIRKCTANLTPREQYELIKVFNFAKNLKWSDD